MNFIQVPGISAILLFLSFSLKGQLPFLETTLQFNPVLSRYEVYVLPSATNNNFSWVPSQISIVVPASMPNNALSIVSSGGGAWLDNTQIYAPAADPAHDFHGISSSGAETALTQGVEKLLFHFSLPGGACVPELRLFVNDTDPGSGAPGMNGGDFSNSIFAIVVQAPGGYESYTGNYNNSGTVCLPLPLELVSFSAAGFDKRIRLEWQTSNEKAFSHFELQRSEDGDHFNDIARIESSHNGLNNTYRYEDQTVSAGTKYFYRLSMEDTDGGFVYSEIRQAVTTTQEFALTGISPNPVRGWATLIFNAPEEEMVAIRLWDISGNLLETKTTTTTKGENLFNMDFSNYAPGLYCLSLNNGVKHITMKIIRTQ